MKGKTWFFPVSAGVAVRGRRLRSAAPTFPGGVLCLVACLAGCAVNPVTGQRELGLVSESQEVGLGEDQYVPSRQMQGGDYILDPQLTRYVNQVGQRLSAASDRKLPYEFVVLNNSVPNAWALPGGKIAVNRGLLLELRNEGELAAVLGHEIVHAAARHGAKQVERGILLQGVVLATGIAVSDSDYAGLAVGGAQLAAGLIGQKYSRDAELEADQYGMQYMARAGYDPASAVALQETFVRLSANKREDWLSGLFASHPPSTERVIANREQATRLGKGGEIAEQRYLSATRRLRETAEAYAAYDKGREKLGEGNMGEAFALAEKALRGEPGEALFYGLRGDIRYSQKRYPEALEDYRSAIDRNDRYFRFYLQRGLCLKALGRPEEAQRDLKSSAELLPSAPAYNALGELALERGDFTAAKGYFRLAAQSDSAVGKSAARSLTVLDLPENPGRYLRAQAVLDRSGYLSVVVENPTAVAVADTAVVVSYRDATGRQRDFRGSFRGRIDPGNRALIRTGLGPVRDKSLLQHVSVRVVRSVVPNE